MTRTNIYKYGFIVIILIGFGYSDTAHAGKLFFWSKDIDSIHFNNTTTDKMLSKGKYFKVPNNAGPEGFYVKVFGWKTVRTGRDYYYNTISPGPYFNTRTITTHIIKAPRHDEWKLMYKQWFNRNGSRGLNKEGIHVDVYEYDSTGKLSARRFLNRNYQLCENRNGIHQVIYKRRSDGHLKRKAYFNSKGKPATNSTGIHLTKYKYSKSRLDYNRIEYYGPDGEKAVDKKGVHRKEYVNKRNAMVSYGPDGKEIFIRERERHDNKGRLIVEKLDRNKNILERAYFSKSRKPVYLTGRMHKIVFTYNKRNQMTSKCYFDARGNPVSQSNGVHCVRKTYHPECGRFTSKAYYGIKGKPVNSRYHRYEMVYRKVGKRYDLVEEKWMDKNGNLVNKPGRKYAKIIMSWYPPRGNTQQSKSTAWFDKAGNPVKGPQGYYSYECDRRGNCKYQYTKPK